MKLGIVSDIHCNRAGLEAALELMGPIDELMCLGDSIQEYRFSNEVIAILRERCAHMVLGNHEELLFSTPSPRAFRHPDNNPALLAWLAAHPYEQLVRYGRKRVLLVHSTPWSPRGAYVYPGSYLLQRIADADADIVLFGHTHMQMVERVKGLLVINPGSAGEACDHRNGYRLSCAVLDTESEEVRVINYPDPNQIGSLPARNPSYKG